VFLRVTITFFLWQKVWLRVADCMANVDIFRLLEAPQREGNHHF
jgi:uncharacterized membrane protein